MKKFLMMALVAVMAFTAQALTTSWKGTKESDIEGQTVKITKKDGKSIASHAFVATVTFPSAPSSTLKLLELAMWDAGTFQMNCDANRNLAFASGGNGALTTPETTAQFEVNKKAAFVLNFVNNGNGAVTTSAYLDGHEIGSVTYAGTIEQTNITVQSSESWTFDNAVLYEGALTQEQIQGLDGKSDIFALPEPTVLALLALGVAGLALKRKVA